MKIATYNLMKGGKRRIHWIKLIEEYSVDLLLVQESYPHHEHLLPSTYPNATGQTAWERVRLNKWGSGLFARSGTVQSITVPGYAGWVVGARIKNALWQKRNAKPLLAFSVHAPAGKGGYWGQVNRLLDEIKKTVKGEDLIIAGDFNILVSQPFDTDRPIVKQEKAIQQRLHEEFQLLNCWQSANPGQTPCQTLRWTGNRTIPYHCDGIFVPNSWKRRLISCQALSGNEWDSLSDHNPMIASFKA